MKTLAALTLLAVVSSHTFAADAPDKPNVLVIFADDMRADTIAELGNPIIQTPNLDRLVRTGVAFRRAYMQGGLNGATCVPSRAMLLSGQNLFHIDEKLIRSETWPEAFARAGYTTFVSGKWHNGDASLARCFQIARSMFTGGMTNPMQAKLREVADGKIGEAHLSPKHACEAFADEAIRFLKERAEARVEAPFLAYIPFDAPHDPHIVPPDFPIDYDPAKMPLPPNFLPQHPWDNGEMIVRDEALLPWPRPPEKVRAMIAEYYRYISYLDSQIGRILDALASSPYAKNTVVVFAADSGVARGSHGLIGKQNLYEFDSVRVPLIISGPGVAENLRTDGLCYLFDVLPTLGQLCGVEGPKTSEGVAFTSLLHIPPRRLVRDASSPGREHLVFAYKGCQRAICDARWKLIRYPEIDRTQLFDLRSDPYELTDLAGQPEFAPKVEELMATLEKELRANGDTGVLRVAKPKPAEWTPPMLKAK